MKTLYQLGFALSFSLALVQGANAQELRPAIPETQKAEINPLPEDIVKQSKVGKPATKPKPKENPNSFRKKHGVVTDTVKGAGKVGKGAVVGVEKVGKGAVVGVETVGKGAGKVGKGAVVGVEKVGKGAVVGVETVGKGAGKVGKGAVVGVETVGKGAVVGVEKLGKGLLNGLKTIGGGGSKVQSKTSSPVNSAPPKVIKQSTPKLQSAPGWNQK